MRSKCTTTLAALVAVFALGAVGAASASAALPEFVPSEGGFPITAEGVFRTARADISHQQQNPPSCEGMEIKGDITGAKTMSLTITLHKCESGSRCYTKGAEIETEILSGTGTLAYISKAEKRVGIVLALTPTELYCESTWMRLRGSIVIPVTPVGTKTSKVGLAIHGDGAGIAEYISYENEKGEKVKAHLEVNERQGALEVNSAVNELTASKPLTISG